jgi:hypothetical protein
VARSLYLEKKLKGQTHYIWKKTVPAKEKELHHVCEMFFNNKKNMVLRFIVFPIGFSQRAHIKTRQKKQ